MSPPRTITLEVTAQVMMQDEATLYVAMSELVGHDYFSGMTNARKSMTARHVADMLQAKADAS